MEAIKMKKTIALTIIAIFLFSLVPFAFAQDKDAAKRLEDMKEKNKEKLQKIADLDKAQIEKLSKLGVKNVDKIAQLKKERLDRLTKLSQEKIERLSELDQDKLEKVSDLNEDDLNKIGALDRKRLRDLTKEDAAKLRAELKKFKVMKVRKAEDLNERNVSDAKLAELKDRFDKSKAGFKTAKDDLDSSRKELNEAIKSKDEKKTIESAKKHLLSFADVLLNHLEKTKAKVEESKNIPEDKVKTITADLDAEIAKVNSLKTEAQAATTKQQVKDEAKKLREEWNKIKSLTKLHAQRVVSARVEGIVNQGLVLEKRLDNMLAKAKEKNISIDVSTEVNSFSEKVAASRDSYKQAQAKISEALDLRAKGEPADSDKIKQLMKDADDLLKQARNSLKEAHDILNTIVKKIKEANPEAKLSEEIEVEVAEETPSTGANATATSST